MSDTMHRTGPLKLVSSKGTLLGTFTLPPDHYAILMQLSRKGSPFEFVVQDRRPIRGSYWSEEALSSMSIKRAILVKSYHWGGYPDAFELYGITIEEFEKLPGHTFAPSAAYIRSLLD